MHAHVVPVECDDQTLAVQHDLLHALLDADVQRSLDIHDDVHVATGSELAVLAAILVACGGFAAACGVAVGSMVRGQTAVVLAVVAWVLFAERVLPIPLLPFTSLLTAAGMGSDDAPPALVGLGSLGVWTAMLAASARRWSISRDVS